MKKFLNFLFPSKSKLSMTSIESVHLDDGEPTGIIESQISFPYKGLRFQITRLHNVATGTYDVIATLGDWRDQKLGLLTEEEADEYEDGIYASLYPQPNRRVALQA